MPDTFEDASESPGRLTRRETLKRGALVAGATVWVAPAVQSLARPAFANASPEEPPGACFGCLTGGGQLITDGEWRNGAGTLIDVVIQFNFGLSPICCDLNPGTELEVNVHNPKKLNKDPLANYHFRDLMVTCTRDGDPTPPKACANRFTGTIADGHGNFLDFSFADYGEPGKDVDTVYLKIYDAAGTVAVADGKLTHGNLQAHLDLGPRGTLQPDMPKVKPICNCDGAPA